MSAVRCMQCGEGTVRPTTGKGRTERYLNIPDLPIPEDLPLMTCDHCGERWDSPADLQRLREALAPAYDQALRNKAHDALSTLRRHGIRPTEVERVVGLSGSYLSRLQQEKAPSPMIVSLLALLARDTARLDELRALWMTTPPRRGHSGKPALRRRADTRTRPRETHSALTRKLAPRRK